MTNLNPAGAAARMMAAKTNSIGYCLVAVGQAILEGRPSLAGHTTANALQAWNDAGKAHQHASNAPVDFPWFISGAGGKGDTVLSTGDGVNCIASDYTDSKGVIHWGHIGVMTLAARVRQVGGTLLGWTDLFLGYTLTGIDPSGGGGTPVPVPVPADPTGYQGRKMNLVYDTLGDGHYTANLFAEDGTLVDSIDNQLGWSGVQPFVPNPIYVIYQQLFDPRATVFNPVLTSAQFAAFQARIASNWRKPAAGTSSSLGITQIASTVQGISDQSDKNVAAMFTQLASILGTDVQALQSAIAAIKLPAFPTVPSSAQNAAATVALLGAKASA